MSICSASVIEADGTYVMEGPHQGVALLNSAHMLYHSPITHPSRYSTLVLMF